MKKSLLHIILFIMAFYSILFAQSNNEEHFSVEWVDNFSKEYDVIKDESIFSQFLNLVTGVSEEKLVKPFNLIKFDKSSYFVLDQGLFKPIIVTDDGFEEVNNSEYKIFPSLVGVCKFSNKKILFTDSKLSKIFIYNINNDKLSLFNTSINIENPTGIIFDKKKKQLYVTETTNHRILVFDVKGKYLRGTGVRGKREGEFNFPTFLTLDKSGNLYVVDALNFRIQIFDNKGNFIRLFGEPGDATGFFNRPKGITVDSYGHIFIVDALFHTVQIFDSTGNYLYNFGGLGQLNSRFWLPVGITIDSDNNIYVADSYNSRIQIFRLIDDKEK